MIYQNLSMFRTCRNVKYQHVCVPKSVQVALHLLGDPTGIHEPPVMCFHKKLVCNHRFGQAWLIRNSQDHKVSEHFGPDWVSRMVITDQETLVFGDALIDDAADPLGTKQVPPFWTHFAYDQPWNQKNERRVSWADVEKFHLTGGRQS